MSHKQIKIAVEKMQAEADWPAAITVLEAELQPFATRPQSATPDLWNRLGFSHFMVGQLDRAETIFLQGIELWPTDIDLLGNLAELYKQQGQLGRATEYINRMLRLDPNDISALLLLGNCSIEIGALDTALMAFRRVQTLAPNTEGIHPAVKRLQLMAGDSVVDSVGEPPPIFVGGAGRSGTTLVRVILDSHPHIACGPELKVLPMIARMANDFQTALYPTLQEYMLEREDIRALFRQMIGGLLANYKGQAGKQRIAEKTPHNALFFQQLHRLFPASPLIHVLRDGRDVISSLLKMNWVDPHTGRPLEYTQNARKAAEYWVSVVQQGRQAGQNPAARPFYYEIRYEDIVSRPEETLQAMFAFIGEPWDPAVLEFHTHPRNLAGESSAGQVSNPLNRRSLGRWQRDLSKREKRIVKNIAGDLLVELGYAEDKEW